MNAGYPTKWPLVSYACTTRQCRVEQYTGTPVYPLVSCPVCQRDGTVIAATSDGAS